MALVKGAVRDIQNGHYIVSDRKRSQSSRLNFTIKKTLPCT